MSNSIQSILNNYVDSFPEKAIPALEACTTSELKQIVEQLPELERATVFRRLKASVASELLASLDTNLFMKLFREMDPVRVAHLISLQERSVFQKQITQLSETERTDLEDLLSFPNGSAGSIMNTKVRSCRKNESVGEVLRQLRKEKSLFRDLFVLDSENKLIGFVPLQDLLVVEESELIADHMHHSPPSVNALSPASEAAEIFENYSISALPVVHVDGQLLGGIQHKSVVDELHRQAVSSIAAMAGASPSESAMSKPLPAVGKRLPWLMINLLTAFIASAVVGAFEDTISQVTALAVLLPVVAGQSGNTGAQAMAVTMRGLALREVRVRQWMMLLFKELRVGFINGLCVALVTGLSVYFWSQNLALGVIMTVAMTFSMIIASMAGAAIPVILTSLGRDPAQSSSVILTTVTDVMGFLSFLGLATLGIAYLT